MLRYLILTTLALAGTTTVPAMAATVAAAERLALQTAGARRGTDGFCVAAGIVHTKHSEVPGSQSDRRPVAVRPDSG